MDEQIGFLGKCDVFRPHHNQNGCELRRRRVPHRQRRRVHGRVGLAAPVSTSRVMAARRTHPIADGTLHVAHPPNGRSHLMIVGDSRSETTIKNYTKRLYARRVSS